MTGFRQKYLMVLLILFSAITALGPVNPFGSMSAENMGVESSPAALVIQGLFIISLLFFNLPRPDSWVSQKIIKIFGFYWVCVCVIFAIENIDVSFFVQQIKFLLCIILFCKLPSLLRQNRKMMDWSIMAFTIVCVVISTLFTCGFLNSYTLWSNGRAAIFMENPNSTSTRMAIATLLLIYLITKNPLQLSSFRFIFLCFTFPLLYTIMASGSRGSFIILVVCLGLYLWMFPTRNKFVKPIIILLGATITFIMIKGIMDENGGFSIIQRILMTIETGEDAGRTELSSAAFNIFFDNFLFGVGPENFMALMKSRYHLTHTVHNLYWYILATSGIIGFILFMSFIISLVRACWFNRKRHFFSIILLSCMLLVASKTGGALTYILMWYIFSICLSLTTPIRKQISK